MDFIWQDDQLICQNEQQEMLGNIGFKMITGVGCDAGGIERDSFP